MKTTMTLTLLSALASFTACASSSAPTERTTGTSAAAATAADVTGTWVFALDRSDVAEPLKKECEGDAHGDVAKAKSCYDAVAIQAAKEKIRFAKDGSGHMVWRSF